MPSAKPAISVIMPVYNTAPYLRRALDSVCRQTFTDLEILCIDDGSTDQSAGILEEYAAKDLRIRVICHGVNRGYSSAMNSGFDAVRGETIGIVDSDDVIGKNFFAELWKVYAAGGCDIVKGRQKERETNGTWYEKELNFLIREDTLNFTSQWASALYKTAFIRKLALNLSTEVATGQDTLFLCQLMGHEPNINFNDKAIYYYLRNVGSMTKAHDDEFYLVAKLEILRILKADIPKYKQGRHRHKMFGLIIKRLYFCVTDPQFRHCHWEVYLPKIKAILSDDAFYSPLKEFPFLLHALKAKNIQEMEAGLKIARRGLDAKFLRHRLGRNYS